MTTDDAPVLVTGATGRQGGATVRALLAAGTPVRALVRNPRTEPAQVIEALGAELVKADLSDRASLDLAVEGARAVFSVQTSVDSAGELAQATNLIDAAKVAGVRQFVQSSTSGVGEHTRVPGWAEGRWAALEGYFGTKQAILDTVRSAGFDRWTVIKPGFFMEDMPAVVPDGGVLATVLNPDTEMALVSCENIGAAAAHALTAPDRFHEVELELAGDRLTMTQIAQTLSVVWGVAVVVRSMSMEEALAAGMPTWGTGHEFISARPESARALGIPVTTFADWAREHLTRQL